MSLIRDTRECARLFALKTVHGLHPHARSGKREKSGDTSSRAASQPSSRVGCGASDFCKKCVSTSVIDAIKERWAAHDKSDHQREVHPNSAERRITGGASLAFCFAMLWINNTQVSDQRPCVSHASVTSCTIPRFCATSLYVSGLRFSARSIAMPGTVVVLGCGSPFCESTETCVTCVPCAPGVRCGSSRTHGE